MTINLQLREKPGERVVARPPRDFMPELRSAHQPMMNAPGRRSM